MTGSRICPTLSILARSAGAVRMLLVERSIGVNNTPGCLAEQLGI